MSREDTLGTDEHTPAPSARGGRRPGAGRKRAVSGERLSVERGPDEHAAHAAHPESFSMTEQERLEMFRASLQQSVLPDLPLMPGYHVCWLSTTNPNDTIAWRLRLGYQLIVPEMIPGFSHAVRVKSGDYMGVIGINEMLAARIPIRAYQTLMKEVHHTRPLEDEGKLRANVNLMRQQAAAEGAEIVEEGDGTADIVQRAGSEPVFAP